MLPTLDSGLREQPLGGCHRAGGSGRAQRLLAWAAAAVFLVVAPAAAETIRLKDGRLLTGKFTLLTGVMNPQDATVTGQKPIGPILVVDDNLRKLFVPKLQVAEILDATPEPLVTFRPWQNPSDGALRISSVGPALTITAWDEHARRIYEMQTADGLLSVVQGITELTPRYATLSALSGPERTVSWTSSLATSSIPKQELAAILAKAAPQDDPAARLQVVRFYNQARRFQEARQELERIIEEFPDKADLKSEVGALRQMAAAALLDEIALRRAAGQHRLAAALLANFPVDDVAGDTLVRVREALSQQEQLQQRIARIKSALREVVAAVDDPDQRGLAAPLTEEIVRDLSPNNADRLTPFVQLLDDPELPAEEKIALASTGWLLGGDQAERSLATALGLLQVRDAVGRYLVEPTVPGRRQILDSILTLDGVSVARVAQLVARMPPPRRDPQLDAAPSGFHDLVAPGQTEDGDFRYLVQLPPEYDPARRYPTLLVLNGAYNAPEQALDFWAGDPIPLADGAAVRRGQAMRRGYLVVAVDWQKPHQYEYQSSSREHLAVLAALRDAQRRFSIDADRVYLTGHGIGGDAAWDLGQAHPDLWAGVIPLVAQVGQKYVRHYWSNAAYVPYYFVAGQLDGRSVAENAAVWNKYLRTPGFDVTVAVYHGRGHEPFADELHALFEWMGRKSRSAAPEEFVGKTLRPWDNFFWWIECAELPEGNMMHPADWSSRGARPAQVEGRRQPENRLTARAPGRGVAIWLSPELVDFSQPVRVTLNGRKVSGDGVIEPSLETLLEDVRTRGDRQRPFWAKVESR